MLELQIDKKTYPDRGGRSHVALRDFALTVRPGEFVCLVGPSGCGKSTLLNIAGGLDRDFSGRALVDGAAPAAGIGFMFQSPRLMPWLSVLDNVRLVLPGIDAEARQRDERKARELLAAMELSDVLDAWPGRLSGGMQRRVALARAFAVEPRLLLMDEPFVSLDAPTADRLRDMLIDLHRRTQSGVLFVTHDLREALALADRVCFLSASPGRVIHQMDVPAAHVRRHHPADAAVGALYDELLAGRPQLLAGLPAPDEVPRAAA
jgi:NitT/TauT family transport system ATP-binding protein